MGLNTSFQIFEVFFQVLTLMNIISPHIDNYPSNMDEKPPNDTVFIQIFGPGVKKSKWQIARYTGKLFSYKFQITYMCMCFSVENYFAVKEKNVDCKQSDNCVKNVPAV